MSYKPYLIKISNPFTVAHTIVLNELHLIILCYVADGFTAPKIKKRLLKYYKICISQGAIENYIALMKGKFCMKAVKGKARISNDDLGEEAVRLGIIEDCNERHVIIAKPVHKALALECDAAIAV